MQQKQGNMAEHIFGALANQARVSILAELGRGELCVSQLSERLQLEQTHISHNLKKLEDTGFVRVRKDGHFRFYSLNLELADPLLTAVDPGWQRSHVSDEDLYKALCTLPLSISVVDVQGTYLYASGDVMHRFNLRKSHFLGRSFFDIFKANAQAMDSMRRALQGETVTWIGSSVGRAQRILTTPYRDDQGQVQGAVSVTYDQPSLEPSV